MTNSATLGSFGDASNAPLVFRNKIINGNFDIWQRGTSQTSSGYGSDDRWFNDNNGTTKTSSRQGFTAGQTDVPNNPSFYSRTVVTSSASSSSYCLKSQRIENAATLSGQTATLSFWAKADAAKNIAVEFVQNFGTGGSPSTAITGIGVTTCALTTSWKYFTVTVSISSVSGKTFGSNNDSYLAVVFWFDAGSTFNARTNSLGQQSGTFDIAQVQLEAGLSATPFEQRPIGMELSLCQRYCLQLGSTTGNAISRISVYTADAMYFGVCTTVPQRSFPPTITGTFLISSVSNIPQTGFTFSIPEGGQYSTYLTIQGSKTAHGLTDGWLKGTNLFLSSEL